MPPAVSAVVAGLAVGALCVAANVVAVRDRQPHRVPVVAAGISPARVQAALDRAQLGAFRVRGVADPLAATVEVQEREAHGALVAEGSRPTVLVAGADGVRPARTVGRSLTGAARDLGLSTPARTRDVVPLQSGDVRGLGLQQVLLGTVLGGFLMGLSLIHI